MIFLRILQDSYKDVQKFLKQEIFKILINILEKSYLDLIKYLMNDFLKNFLRFL